MKTLPRNQVLQGDAAAALAGLLPESVDAVVTSPPYFQLRDYGVSGQLGLEATVDDWVASLTGLFRLVARVLKPHGSVWLNLGDTYSRSSRTGAPPKGLLLAPERLLLALAADGWLVRSKVVWAKPNPMPESAPDRLASTWEPLYFLTRSRRYVFDLDAIREPHKSAAQEIVPRPAERNRQYLGGNGGLGKLKAAGAVGHALGKNPGDVWTLAKARCPEAHFATFPEALVERPILATVPEQICVQCDTAFQRESIVERRRLRPDRRPPAPSDRNVRHYRAVYETRHYRGKLLRCDCFAPTRPGIVLDPFFGSGTVGVVAERLRRDWLGIELNPVYVELAERRIREARQRREAAAEATVEKGWAA